MIYIDNKKSDFEKYATKHMGINQNILDGVIGAENSLTPYILEEREMRMTQMDIFSRLMRDRIIWIAGPIDDNVSTIVQAQLLYLMNVDKDMDVTMHLDTPGGSVKSGLSMIDMMEYVSYDIPTINTGMCASMGSVLLAAGTKGKRSSLRFSKVMTHQVSHKTGGNIQETRISHQEGEKYNFLLFKLLAKYSNKTWQEFLEYSSRDRWFSSDTAKEYGLIDEIVLPDGCESNEELMKGFDEYEKLIKTY